ncbi:MAG: isoprenyl transferase [Bacteroidales bacterium]|nr:isoprenyl transferase [Bacteroidales bacterium]MCF8404415.1 isoprenyl transferase [Bacteroidales bacterium]
MSLKDKIDKDKLPQHIAIIMDGNGRWAKQKGKLRIYGHKHGVISVRETAETAAELGIKYLTLYAFSTENWSRPRAEVNALMKLLVQTIHKETKTLHENQIRLNAIGNLDALPGVTRRELEEAIKETAKYDKMSMTLALSYSSRWEITNMVKEIADKVNKGEILAENIDQELIAQNMVTHLMPDPELLIRTSGEYRISNFLLWQIAYSELYFTPVLWPDFRKENLYEAIIDFQQRERRFGKTTEQIKK